MNKNTKILCVFISLLFMVSANIGLKAEDIIYNIQVSWGYTPPSQPQVLGYALYLEGQKKIVWDGWDTQTGAITILLPSDQYSNFTLTAVFSDGTESPHSAPFPFKPGESGDPTPFQFKLTKSMLGDLYPDTKIKYGGISLGG